MEDCGWGEEFLHGETERSRSIKVYILTQGKDAADAAANLEKYGKWVDTLKK